MSFIFQIKRRLAGDPGPPADLTPGELAFNEVENVLYIAKTPAVSGSNTSTLPASATDPGMV